MEEFITDHGIFFLVILCVCIFVVLCAIHEKLSDLLETIRGR